ncbi:hypothetical protein [Pelagibius sp. Alg239-R121]|uniref:hypothetical protein n=1 Tax=Pelagibius sp. Alg239-R121 TaxID=2993448 RepID=UPI0024A6BB7F|nr:hypothetical protein [Pelagibius sp. Alg239-R121]
MSMPEEQREVPGWDISSSYVARFTRRALLLFSMAGSILLVIFALLGFGAFVFVYASGIAARDISGKKSGDLLSAELRNQSLESEIGFLQKVQRPYQFQFEVGEKLPLELMQVERRLNAAKGRYKLVQGKLLIYDQTGFISKLESFETPEELTVARETLAADLKILKEFQNWVRDDTEKTILNEEISESLADLAYVEALLKQPKSVDGETGPLTPETIQILQTNITRFGTLLLVFFFIRILLPIYRYFVSLGTVYRGHADALILLRQTGQEDLAKFVAAMTPALGFEKAPATPIGNTLQLIKEIAPMLARR